MKAKKIYIAGPYTKGDVAVNVKNAMDAANELINAGHYPFCPHLSHFLHMNNPQPYQVWIDLDLVFLPDCDALLRLEGDSAGADGEVRKANELGMPVYYSIEEFLTSEKS
jgi:hypothetical protein